MYRGADRSLARPGRKQANVFVRMGMNFLRRLALQEKKLDDSSRLYFIEIARVPDKLPSLFPSWSGLGLISTPVIFLKTSLTAAFLIPDSESRITRSYD